MVSKCSKLKIGLAQINPTVGDLKYNSDKIISYINKAKQKGIQIIVFPELCLSGYPPEDLLLKGYFLKDNRRCLNKIAQHTDNIIAIIGFPNLSGRFVYNSAAVIAHKKIYGVYNKVLLPNYGVFDEKRYFTTGKYLYVFRTNQIIFGVNICEDIWHKDGPHALQAKAGSSLIINISSSPYHKGKLDMRKILLIQRARQTRAFIAYCNIVGGQDELVFDGASFIVGPYGKIFAMGKQFQEDLLVADLEIPHTPRRKGNMLKGIKLINLPQIKIKKGRRALRVKIPKIISPEEEVYAALALGLKDYVLKNGFSKVALGLSGGIDSALCLCIAVDALGKNNVIALNMPSKFSTFQTQNDAKILAQNLGVRFIRISISDIYEVYLEGLEDAFKGLPSDITEENIQARIRGNILMAFSNKFGWLIITTGNKSETSVGYTTLYGDTAGGFALIKDVPKTLVYKLARYRNKIGFVIPQSIFTRPPTAELRANQKDTDSLPPYSLLDKIIKAYIEQDASLDEIIKSGINKNIVRRVINMIDRNEYKRRQAPPGIKITPRAFGRDRRMPITNKYVK